MRNGLFLRSKKTQNAFFLNENFVQNFNFEKKFSLKTDGFQIF